MVGLVGAAGKACTGLNQLFRTRDGGKTWRPVLNTCGPTYRTIEPESRRTLYAAAGDEAYDTPRPRSVLRRSMDGGRTWRTVKAWRGHSLTVIAFGDIQHGLAVDEKWHPGAGGGYVCPRLRATADGGASWTSRTLPVSTRGECRDAAGGGARVPTAFVGSRYAWVGDEGGGVIGRTRDGGRTWQLSANPRTLGYTELDASLRRGAYGPVVQTAGGPATTRNGGQSWISAQWPSHALTALAEHRGAYLRYVGQPGRYEPEKFAVMVTPDGGATWKRLRLPGGRAVGAYEVAFTAPNRGVVAMAFNAFATQDGGRTWRRIQVPRSAGHPDAIKLGPGVLVISPRGERPLISTDKGRTWRRFAEVGDDCWSVSRPIPTDVWIECVRGNFSDPLVVLAISHDRGKTWILRSRRMHSSPVVVTGAEEAWLVTEAYHNIDFFSGVPKKLWHTTDGGATWYRTWVSLRPGARIVSVARG
jgi:photosystem II stability/assembly factor-like uncharacterized protein